MFVGVQLSVMTQQCNSQCTVYCNVASLPTTCCCSSPFTDYCLSKLFGYYTCIITLPMVIQIMRLTSG